MLFITNRAPKEGLETKIGRKFTFDLDNNGPVHSVFYCSRKADGTLEEIGSQKLMEIIRKSDYRQVLIYIHGFANLPEDVFSAAIEFQSLCDQRKQDEVLVLPIIWPCDNDLGIIKDYYDDQDAADESRFSLARVLHKFIEWRNKAEANPQDDPCLMRMNILAHSMGSRVYRGALEQWNQKLVNGVPLLFRNSFLVASDVVNETLERGQTGELISHASRNVVVYYASDDLALRASKAANLKNMVASRRLGHTGPDHWDRVKGNVYGVDCDDVNTVYDSPKGHSYFRSAPDGKAGRVFDLIFNCIETGRVGQADRNMILTK